MKDGGTIEEFKNPIVPLRGVMMLISLLKTILSGRYGFNIVHHCTKNSMSNIEQFYVKLILKGDVNNFLTKQGGLCLTDDRKSFLSNMFPILPKISVDNAYLCCSSSQNSAETPDSHIL
jgi:hypothetical protein